MTQLQLCLVIGVPTVAALLSLAITTARIANLRTHPGTELQAFRVEVRQDLATARQDLSGFRADLKLLSTAIDHLTSR